MAIPKNERCKKWTKKWEEHSTFESMERVRGKVSASFAIKKYTVSEHMEVMCFQTVRHHVNKKMDVLIEQCYALKFCVRLKKSNVETITPLKEDSQILVVPIIKM